MKLTILANGEFSTNYILVVILKSTKVSNTRLTASQLWSKHVNKIEYSTSDALTVACFL